MTKFRVFYHRVHTVQCYVEVEATNAFDAANKAQDLIIDGDDPLVEMPETGHVETQELGRVEEVETEEPE